MMVAGRSFEDPSSTFHQHRSSSSNHIQNTLRSNSIDMANPKRQHKRSNSLSALISFNLDLDEETEPSPPSQNDDDDEDIVIDLSSASKKIISDAQLWSEFQRRLRESKKAHSNTNAQQILVDIIQEYNHASEMATCEPDQQPPKTIRPKSKVERAASASTPTSNNNIYNLAEMSSRSSNSNDQKRMASRRRATMDTLFTSSHSANHKTDASEEIDASPAACSSTSWSPPTARGILKRNEETSSSADYHRQPSFSSRIAQIAMRTRLSLADEEVDMS